MSTAEKWVISPEDYLEGEKASEIRHEFVDGEVFAMAGGSDAHEQIAGAVFALSKAHLKTSGCRSYVGGMKVQVNESKYFYPDVMVTCEKRNADNKYAKQSPKLIIEVLSPSTEAYDRGDKFAYYRQLNSLEEYVLISQERYLVEVFRRNAENRWELFSFESESCDVEFASIAWKGNMQEIYDDVEFEIMDAS